MSADHKDFRVAQYALDAANYFAMHAAAPQYNTWGSIAEARLRALADELGYDLVKRNDTQEAA